MAAYMPRQAENITPDPGFTRFPNPTLMLAGGDSRVTWKNPRKTEVFNSFAEYVERYKIEVIGGAEHTIVSDQPEACVKAINRFLEDN